MKKITVIVVLIALIAGICLFSRPKPQEVSFSEYLRIHIRADSNQEEAQAVKYRVRDRVVEFLTPLVAECETKAEAKSRLGEKLPQIEEVAAQVLRENGFSYGAKAKICREKFPTRVYENVTLEAGVYDALVLELGSGSGDNWWCVVYPPLCFGGGTEVVYRSKIKEIVDAFFQKKESE